ncbi:glycosyl hydrolase family 95 catalytic domain-containing protein [Amycolatopsis orientalis]|uniref:glycoside hydrolase family 95 protein n=1 Tax=Amycolatopsis orientalis TaxID=31958 RepID=UPI00191C7C2F|nr:glycoside hydrolase N-terminal domain-containing protein [Amycolatopsis orientalis]
MVKVRFPLLAGVLLAGVLTPLPAYALPGAAACGTPPVRERQGLWYDRPATDWESQTLPIGNGALGATVHGGVAREHLQFNEKSLWSGGPGADPAYTGGNWESPRPGALAEARKAILEKGPQQPEAMAALLGQPKRAYGSYQSFGDVYLDGAEPAEVKDYRRELDISRALSRVGFVADGVRYTRESFASYPDGVIVVRVSADRPGAVSFTTRLTSPHPRSAVSVSDGRLTLAGELADNGMALEAQLLVRNQGGSRVDSADGIAVSGADSVTLVLAAGTDYVHRYPDYVGRFPHQRVGATIDAAARRSFDDLLARHERDYRTLYDRVRLDIGQQTPSMPTDRLLAAYTGGPGAADRALEALFFNYGRYLLVSSSRPGSLPANLQGVWNQSSSAPWSADYHVNINLQMNYWPAEVTNLGETTPPLFDFIDRLRPRGRETARTMFDAGGFVLHNETNPFDYTGVHDWPTAFWFPESAAWLSRHLWEHYEFTQDRGFLREKAYPILREAARFWLDSLQADPRDGKLVAVPSYSPEHGPYTAGAAMSQQVVWDLFTNVLDAGEVLGGDQAFRSRVAGARAKLDPGLRVGSWGQLQEWKEDLDDPADTHRHVSHLYGLHPGRQISPLGTPEFAAAAEKSLAAREAGGTAGAPGWSRAWKANFWARLLKGESAFEAFRDQLRFQTLPNLWDTHPPFQIDGNFGATAAVAEMLVQSQTGTVHLLPALPSAWPAGQVDGLRARGAFTVGATWRAGQSVELRLCADKGGPVSVKNDLLKTSFRVLDAHTGRTVRWTRTGIDTIRLDTRPGGAYLVKR